MLGVCYYPEHWPETMWADDARRMAELGLRYVRIGEFSWSVVEPEPGRFDWGWLDRAVETLGAAGLKIVMGTPTATPPKWLVDRSPDILPHDARGRPRRFGSRRHYCFSSATFRDESRRITEAFAVRYGRHDGRRGMADGQRVRLSRHGAVLFAVGACRVSRVARRRYGDVAALNEAWGNRFWSMSYRSFDEIDLPMECGDRTQSNSSDGLLSLLVRAGGALQRRAGGDHPASFAGPVRDAQLHGRVSRLRSLEGGRGDRSRELGFLSAGLHRQFADDGVHRSRACSVTRRRAIPTSRRFITISIAASGAGGSG